MKTFWRFAWFDYPLNLNQANFTTTGRYIKFMGNLYVFFRD